MAISDKELDRILIALSHPLRRRILQLVGSRGRIGYSEMLRELGVESSILSFHLKKLQGLVEKTSSGDYVLTVQGRTALRVLRTILGGETPHPGMAISGRALVVVDDELLLEAYKAGGLVVDGVGVVFVERGVSRLLYRKTVKRIRALVVYVPGDLRGYTSSISSAETIIGYNRRGFDPEKPVEIIRDLEKRGFRSTALKLREMLGIGEETAKKE